MAKAAFYTVRESFVGNLGGREVEYHKGEVVEGDDPAVKKMPAHFEEIVIRGGQPRGVEQATAAPGEKRELSKPSEGKALTTDDVRPKGRGA